MEIDNRKILRFGLVDGAPRDERLFIERQCHESGEWRRVSDTGTRGQMEALIAHLRSDSTPFIPWREVRIEEGDAEGGLDRVAVMELRYLADGSGSYRERIGDIEVCAVRDLRPPEPPPRARPFRSRRRRRRESGRAVVVAGIAAGLCVGAAIGARAWLLGLTAPEHDRASSRRSSSRHFEQ